MRKATPKEMNRFVADLAEHDRQRQAAFYAQLSDAERGMTVGEFIESRRSSQSAAKHNEV